MTAIAPFAGLNFRLPGFTLQIHRLDTFRLTIPTLGSKDIILSGRMRWVRASVWPGAKARLASACRGARWWSARVPLIFRSCFALANEARMGLLTRFEPLPAAFPWPRIVGLTKRGNSAELRHSVGLRAVRPLAEY